MRRARSRRLRVVDDGITPELLVALYELHVRRKADALAAPYLGRYISVHGRIGDIVGVRRMTIVRFDRRARPESVRIEMLFRGWGPDSSLRSGDTVTVVGAIRAVVRSQVTLDHCQVVASTSSTADAE